jgi:hypothetical protein
MLLPALTYSARYPLRGPSRLTDLGLLSGYGGADLALYTLGMALMFGLYALALREVRRLPARSALPAVFGCALLLAVAFLPMYPATAVDVFGYAVWSRLYTVYGADPMATPALPYLTDPVLAPVREGLWAYQPSPYGPLWRHLAAPISALTGDRLVVAVAGFKLLAALALLAGGGVIAWTLARLQPSNAAAGALLYLWNPLALWEVAGNGHNDAVMAAPLLLAFLAWSRRRDTFILPLLLAAALIKFAALLLLPLAALAVWRRAPDARARGRTLITSGCLGVAVVAFAFYPFYGVAAVALSVRAQSGVFLVSPANVVVGLLRDCLPQEFVSTLMGLMALTALSATLSALGLVVWRRPASLPRASFELLYVFLLGVTWYFQGWYLVWPLALAALVPPGWPSWRMLAWTAGAMASYVVFIWVRAWHVVDGDNLLRLGVAVITLPTALLTLAELRARTRRAAPPRHIGRSSSGGVNATE